MSDSPSPEDVIEARLRPMVLLGGSHVMTSHVVSALRDAGYRIVSADDAAKLDRLRECRPYERHPFGIAFGPGEKNWTLEADTLFAYLNGDGE